MGEKPPVRDVWRHLRQSTADGYGPLGHYRLTRKLSGSRRRALHATYMAYVVNARPAPSRGGGKR
jgi:hypothetical protein